MFELTTILGGDVFVYRLEYNGVEIRQETLTKNAAPLYAINGQKGDFTFAIRAEGYSNERLQSILDVECSDGKGHQTACFLNRVARNYAGLNADLKQMFDAFNNYLVVLGNYALDLSDALDLLSPFYNGDRKAALDAIVAIVRRLDIDIRSIALDHRVVAITEESLSNVKGRVHRILPDRRKIEVVDIRSVITTRTCRI